MPDLIASQKELIFFGVIAAVWVIFRLLPVGRNGSSDSNSSWFDSDGCGGDGGD